jgi:hypothetical protein
VEEDSVRPYEDQVLQWLVGGGSVVVLAQVELPQELADALEMELTSLATEWGSTPFVFTNGTAELVPSLPARRVLATELLSATPEHVYTRFGERRDSTVCAVGILKVPPAPIDGLVVGRRAVLGGRLTVCQLPLAAGVVAGDALCTGLLVDLLSCAGDTAL